MGSLKELIAQYPQLSSVEDRLLEADSRLDELEEKNRHLRQRVASLKEENQELREKLAKLSESSEFVEVEGVLWKRRADGSYESLAYCPHCKVPLSECGSMLICRRCNWEAPIGPNRLSHIHDSLS